ncbi:aminotransferase class I/II-fold pyridoxal phosphate-dependent enzyme [Proteiniclasticum ruminis]|uniref:Cystathionine beta-lyase family protein involved in aluminum resistance n=1 Tax=Proteiniclasticum ruminis TaxID=398199 RepID=A0A1I4Y3H8_9CLOT|nr:methionine gamma-lyase family protein [Proteiniclasticum ruminis]SFN32681.1 Cystathionine beta-lyase family protein involved in aluminum resistance [Proteiniclasticum ruminis]
MYYKSKEYLMKEYNISEKALDLHEKAMEAVTPLFKEYEDIREYNQFKVLKAFQDEKISDYHFTNTTGYGYGDIGRDTLDLVYARIFKAEKALVRPQFVSGTHAISCVLYGILRPGDTLLAITGRPYDTIHGVIGIGQTEEDENTGSLYDFGVQYAEIELKDNAIQVDQVLEYLKKDTSVKMLHIQRSKGYADRNSFTIEEIGKAIGEIRKEFPEVIIFVDNCYGEFIEEREPIEVGADIVAGSLIKNAGGGISPTGGYVAGKTELVDLASYRLTVPGLGGECGSTFGVMRTFFQGLFLAPQISMEALKTAVYTAKLLELAGFEVHPRAEVKRTDIVQAITFRNKEKLIDFVKGIQYGAPIDSNASCEPWDMPGYKDQVIMAAGAFIQGASIELSCDAPIREPYTAYFQGGLSFDHGKIGVLIALSRIL